MFRRIGSFVLAVILVIGMCPSFALALSASGEEGVSLAPATLASDVSLTAGATGLTNAQKATVKSKLLTAIKNLDDNVAISWQLDSLDSTTEAATQSVITDEVFQIFSNLVNENPNLFYVGEQLGITFELSGSGVNGVMTYTRTLTIAPKYSYAKDKIPGMKSQYEAKVNNARSWAKNCSTDLQKAKAVHDWFVRNCHYNFDAASKGRMAYGPDPWNAYGALVKNYPVCQGYALAYEDVMHRLGIECTFVTQDLGNNQGHAWNRIKIGGKWYNVDVTWDDNCTDGIDGNNPSLTPQTDFFMKSDAWFKSHPTEEGYHKSWTPKGVAGTDTTYDAYTVKDWPAYDASGVVSGGAGMTTKSIAKCKMSSISKRAYTGKQLKPAVTVKDGKKTLVKDRDYTVSYAKNRLCGKATVTVVGKGSYTGKLTGSFIIVPKKVAGVTTTSKNVGKAKVKWGSKDGKAAKVTGYQVWYKAPGKTAKTVLVKGASKTNKTIAKLPAGKKVKVKVRAYKTVGGSKKFGAWSKAKTVTIKSGD